MGNARLDRRKGQGPIILVGPRGAARLARLRSAVPASRGLRGLAAFWGVVLLAAAGGAAALQALGPPRQLAAPVASTASLPAVPAPAPALAPAASAPAPAGPGPASAAASGPVPPAQAPETPSPRLGTTAFVAIPTPEALPVPPLPVAAPPSPAPNAVVIQPAGVSAALSGAPNAPVRRAVIHYRADSASEDLARLADRARTVAGRVELRAVPATPSRPGIRYFFNEDAGAAETLASALSGAGAGTFPIRGFPDYRPSPQPGTIEVWLP